MPIGLPLHSRYELLSVMGEGGSAKVYKAIDTHLGREVALKILHEYVAPSDRVRFEREIRTLAKLTHPYIIPIYDLGLTEQQQLFFTMQLLSGGDFHAIGPLEASAEHLRSFFRAARAVLYGLEHLHSHNMVHRDLTPHNILLGQDGLPRIMDFGLVYASEHSRDLTRTGYTLGTPQYMSPEQAKGGAVGSHSDIYAFGAVLYRTVTGKAPFEGDNDQSILYQHVYEKPIHPSTVNPLVPEILGDAILKFLAKKPTDRPQSGTQAMSVLEHAREHIWENFVLGNYRGGFGRSGLYFQGPTHTRPLKKHWELKLKNEISWPSAITANEDYLAIGTRGGTVAVLEMSGHVYAEYQAGDEVTAPVTLDHEHIVYGAWDGSIQKTHLRHGVMQWRHRSRAEITTCPTRLGNVYVVASRDGHLHAVHAVSGELIWAYKTVAPIAASPIVWGGNTIVADEEGWVHGLDAISGAPLWKLQLSAVHATPAVYRACREYILLLIPCWNGELHAIKLDLVEGRYQPSPESLEWTYDLEGEMWSSPAVHQHRVFVASWAGKVHCLDARTGDDIWVHDVQERITASVLVASGFVYIGTESGLIQALDEFSGTVVWQEQAHAAIQATPLLAKRMLFVAFLDGTVVAYR